MSNSTPSRSSGRPVWVDESEYPFASHFFETGDGRMHYVDEGHGPPVVLIHGTPTWSFLYRHLIAGLSPAHRVIAPDHLGFGLSDKPADAPYRPADHARRLAGLLDHLALGVSALVVHDFGGPIGLSYVVEHPERVSALVLFNTWMWSLATDRRVQRASRIAAGPLGRFLYRRLNFSPRMLIPMVMGDRRKLTRRAHEHYTRAFPSSAERVAPWVLARELAGSADWYDSLWRRRAALADKPALLLWGMRDPTFGEEVLARWQEALPLAKLESFADAGHFVQEEVGASLVGRVASFLARTRTSPVPADARV